MLIFKLTLALTETEFHFHKSLKNIIISFNFCDSNFGDVR